LVDTGERFLVQTAGGGGYAEARLRERAAIDRDVAEGYVSASSRKAAATDDRG
jgi:N-methylhydantoinase B/oxoprolinase/acetone carboxylase alpha subunit